MAVRVPHSEILRVIGASIGTPYDMVDVPLVFGADYIPAYLTDSFLRQPNRLEERFFPKTQEYPSPFALLEILLARWNDAVLARCR